MTSLRWTPRSRAMQRSSSARWAGTWRTSRERARPADSASRCSSWADRSAREPEVVADLIGLDGALEGATWAFTGEGRTDTQTLLRKAPFVVAERARAAGVPITLLSGAVDAASLPELARVFSGCFALPSGPMTLADCIAGADDVARRSRGADRARVGGKGRVEPLARAHLNGAQWDPPARTPADGRDRHRAGVRPIPPRPRNGAPGAPAADRSRSARRAQAAEGR